MPKDWTPDDADRAAKKQAAAVREEQPKPKRGKTVKDRNVGVCRRLAAQSVKR